MYSTRKDSVNITRNLILYPNPTDGNVTVELPYPFDSQGTIVKIFNDLGKLIRQEAFSADRNKRSIKLSDLAAGIYVITFKSLQSKAFKKVVLVH
ncbi:MAG: T9SS type A sorting domain-containing protein [Bacteroidetes bacterium]|nr:T9SS type A sorting domain-containing protein [Bacteroidota bacterium]